jgi:predicted dehydrogenase
MILVGTGGQGARWCELFLPPNVADDTVEVVAAVDVDEAAHENATDHLDLTAEDCYTDAETAFAEVPADCCALVVPPQFREDLVSAALAHDLDILAEKPIAETLPGAVRIADQVAAADAKMGVTMSHRFREDVTTIRRRVQEGVYGPVDYLVCRYAVNARTRGSWVERLYDVEDPLLLDGAIHHLDLLSALADGDPETVYAQAWNPEWSDFADDPQGLVTVTFEEGTRALYEGANTNAVSLNGWGNEYLRAECRDATAVLHAHELREFAYDADDEGCLDAVDFEDGEHVPLDERDKWSNAWLIEQFVDWLEGGDPMPTHVEANLESMALVFAAIESAESGESVAVRDVLERAREEA